MMVKIIYVSLLIFFVFQAVFSQKLSVFKEQSTSIQAFQLDNYQERIYVHLDKSSNHGAEFANSIDHCHHLNARY